MHTGVVGCLLARSLVCSFVCLVISLLCWQRFKNMKDDVVQFFPRHVLINYMG